MSESSPQRAYRAACPGCGAPVSFRSAQSSHAVCGYCQSTVVRNGEVLSRTGKMAELFDDHSLVQIGATGKVAVAGDAKAAGGSATVGFVVVGRLQYQSSQGVWTEWAVLQDDGETAFLSEDNGSYVYARPRQIKRALPDPKHFRLGATTAMEGRSYSITSIEQVILRSAEGELTHLPEPGHSFTMVELRSQGDTGATGGAAGGGSGGGAGSVLTLDYGPTLAGLPMSVTLGQEVQLPDLAMTGLKTESAREEKGRQFDCPACGAPVTVELSSTKSLTCASCHSLIDLSKGVGAELLQARQDEPVEPLIALGTTGRMQGQEWQVVGFQHRMGTEPDDPDEHFGWSEYLLYNAQRGFQFLVDAEDGWSLVKPTTGAPVLAAGGQSATYLGTKYTLQWAYKAETNYVAGEFYWPVQRGQKTFNRDFISGQSLLSQEESPTEVVWSSGRRVQAKLVADAFGLQDKLALMARQDAGPVSSASGMNKVVIFIVILLIVLLLVWLNSRDDCDPNVQNCATSSGSRTSGGSWGGYSSGGSHK